MEPLLVVLDLDETLIHASEYGFVNDELPDFYIANHYPTYKRPGLDVFLENLFKEFQVAAWTSASPGYAKSAVPLIFNNAQVEQLAFVWDSDRCTQKYDPEWFESYWTKNLKKVKAQGYDLSRVVAVDDTAQKYENSYGNLVHIKAFEGQLDDNELPKLFNYLRWLNTQPNVRKVEKRGWSTSEVSKL